MPGAIYAEGLVKTFGEVRALDGVDLDVPEGTVLGLLGPNGAGKTTAVRVLTTLLRPDSGKAFVAGVDVLERPNDVRRSIGLSGQFAAVDEYLTGRENLQMVGRLYQLSARAAKARASELLERFNLAEAGDRPAKTYSGGMRRRLDLAAALVISPPVMFMDEPTTGLDPRNRQALWEVIQELVAGGTTLLLTTQYLEEADHLAHDICVVDHGRVIARGTSDQLKARTGGERVEIVAHRRDQLRDAAEILGGFGKGEVGVEEHTRKVTVPVTGGAKLLAEVIREFDARGVEIDDVGLRRPTLDDVFISLTGHAAEDGDAARDGGAAQDGDGGSPDGTGGSGAARSSATQSSTARSSTTQPSTTQPSTSQPSATRQTSTQQEAHQ
ncbi:ATP-binding cassette domain-containing protein [Streptomyces sp. NPDC001922]|uniref:ATP-binding cassette domain-containing protein n=1 Tax=Streptomyces sp. NPDC001922 TaxID=3364624 RepID=UPI0036CA2D16